jgi:hypothetical protein
MLGRPSARERHRRRTWRQEGELRVATAGQRQDVGIKSELTPTVPMGDSDDGSSSGQGNPAIDEDDKVSQATVESQRTTASRQNKTRGKGRKEKKKAKQLAHMAAKGVVILSEEEMARRKKDVHMVPVADDDDDNQSVLSSGSAAPSLHKGSRVVIKGSIAWALQ